MADYPPPVDRLLSLGECGFSQQWINYRTELGLGPKHVADLIRMAADEELNQADSESSKVWAPIHALRALGQLRAVEAVEPLLAAMRASDGTDDYLLGDLPRAFGLIGPAAIPATARLLTDSSNKESDRTAAAMALEEIGKAHPEARAECIEILTRQLARRERGPDAEGLNGWIITSLIALEATESAPVIEAAFAAGVVDEGITGNWEYVRYDLGLGPRPSEHRYPQFEKFAAILGSEPRPARPDLAKILKKRKAQKRARKQSRRR